MPVSTPPTVAFGDPLLASEVDALLLAADDRLARLFSGGRTWYAFDTTAVPTQQIPTLGAIYVLSADADRDMLPSPGGIWPAQYDHSAHIAAAAAMTVTGPDANDVAWEVTGAFAPDIYQFGDSASVLEREHLGETRPLKLASAYEPERFHRYALADVFIEAASATDFEWTFDKYGVVRIHNFSTHPVNVDLGSATISIGPRRIRTVRKTSRTGAWDTTVRRYFPRVLPGDLPLWDSDTTGMANRPLRSQGANPIFRQSLLQYMFQPQVLTDSPGMFSSSVVPVLTGSPTTIADAIVQQGAFDVVRTSTTDPLVQDVFTVLYSGETLASTPASWGAIGLTVSLDDATRGAVLESAVVGSQFDAISRTTNVLGGAIVAIDNGGIRSRTLLPWFEDATAADAWYSALFLWPTYTVTRTPTNRGWISDSVWTPLGGGADTDYFGSWSAGTSNVIQEFRIEWDGASYGTVSAWNVFTKTVASALPPTGTLVRQPLLTAVVAYPSVTFWAEQDGSDDNAGPIFPRTNANDRGIYVASDYWGLGSVNEDGGWTEPRWQLALFPTIGWGATSSWFAYPQYGAEELIWTPLLPDGSGGSLSHWRVTSPEGAAGGADWGWDYAGTASAGSDMSFWRMFLQSRLSPGAAVVYPDGARMGPQPWGIQDHGYLADLALDAGASWQAIRAAAYDDAPVAGSELEIGMQFRVNAAAFNQISALIAGMDYVRPCGWEQYVDGFPFSSLVTSTGWYLGYRDLYVQPFGAVHLYALDFATDAKLDALGIVRRSATNADLQAFQSVSAVSYDTVETIFDEILYYDVVSSSPTWDANLGNSRQYCTADDIHDALAAEEFSFNQIRLVQPIDIESFVPGDDETEVDTYVQAVDPTSSLRLDPVYRVRFEQTRPVPVPATSSDLQIAPAASAFYSLRLERPMWASIVSRAGSVFGTISLRTTGPTSGPLADSIDRWVGETPEPLWSATVLARAGLTAKILCLPERRAIFESQGEDSTGPRTRIPAGLNYNVPVVLPNDTVRPKWVSVSAGSEITTSMLVGPSPSYPDDHHVWTLLPLDGSIEAM